jgi:hypothetical protein
LKPGGQSEREKITLKHPKREKERERERLLLCHRTGKERSGIKSRVGPAFLHRKWRERERGTARAKERLAKKAEPGLHFC